MMMQTVTWIVLAVAGAGLTVDENGFVTVDPEDAAREQRYFDRVAEAEEAAKHISGDPVLTQRAIDLFETILRETETIELPVRIGFEFRVAGLHTYLGKGAPKSPVTPPPRLRQGQDKDEFQKEVERYLVEVHDLRKDCVQDEEEFRKAVACYENIVQEAAEAYPYKAKEALDKMAAVYATQGKSDDETRCIVRLRRLARTPNPVPSDSHSPSELDELQSSSLERLRRRSDRLSPSLRAEIIEGNQDDPELVAALTPAPEPQVPSAAEPLKKPVPTKAAASAATPAPPAGHAAKPSPTTPPTAPVARATVPVILGVVTAMAALAVLVVLLGRSRTKKRME